jgi:hypothetical protein
VSAATFEPWPKIARLNRGVVITEKIDGTNAAVVIIPWSTLAEEVSDGWNSEEDYFRRWHREGKHLIAKVPAGDVHFGVFAQSRTRYITPGDDNFGFAKWVEANASALVTTLGPGRHFGEWWGSGIQRGYGLTGGERRFSLFNVHRWADADLSAVHGLGAVPILNRELGIGRLEDVPQAVEHLRAHGSLAAPGFATPEGVIVWHTAARELFKVTLADDEAPKSAA